MNQSDIISGVNRFLPVLIAGSVVDAALRNAFAPKIAAQRRQHLRASAGDLREVAASSESPRNDGRRLEAPLMRFLVVAAIAAVAATAAGCGRDAEAMTPQTIEQHYGVAGAYTDTVATGDGALKGTSVPVTLADGRTAQLFIPAKALKEPHAVYLRDSEGLHPVSVQPNVTRDEMSHGSAVIEKHAEPAHANKRSWEKEALIIGGAAGAGTAIGAATGGKKGAGIGAAAGGIGGLIYDVVTRDKK